MWQDQSELKMNMGMNTQDIIKTAQINKSIAYKSPHKCQNDQLTISRNRNEKRKRIAMRVVNSQGLYASSMLKRIS